MQDSNQPITVLMPVYNQKPDYLKKSIESILNQSFPNFEFLIIDDGSTEKPCTEMLAYYASRDSRIKIVRNEKNFGYIRSLNIGLEKSLGKYIARMDSDDISETNRLEKQHEFMENNPDHILIGTQAYLIDENDKIIGKKQVPMKYEVIKKDIIKYNFFTHPSWFFRRSLIKQAGNYLEKAVNTEDYDFILRIAQKYKISNLPDFLLRYRMNMQGVSFSNNKMQERHTVKAKLRAIKEYGYPKTCYLYVLMSILVYLFLPFFIKKRIIMLTYSNK